MYIAKNTIPNYLLNEFRSGRVVVFVGAGLSMSAGLPSWRELLGYLEKKFISESLEERDFYRSCDELEKAQYLYDISDKSSVIKCASELFSSSQVELKDSSIHQVLASLPTSTIVTTNWDTLIEEAHESMGVPVSTVWKDEHLISALGREKVIFKIHGDINDLDSVVFSEEDYLDFQHKNEIIRSSLSTLIAGSTILMVGYSYRDYNFKLIQRLTEKRLEGSGRKMYMLMLNENDRRIRYIQNRGLIALNFQADTHDQACKQFFGVLGSAVSIVADQADDRLRIVSRENGEVLERGQGVVLRNMSALGPLATPLNPSDQKIFEENTELEMSCAKNWQKILDHPRSTAKLIFCLNDDSAKLAYRSGAYRERLEVLRENLIKYRDKIEVVDAGSPLIMSNLDIYGTIVVLENIKTNVQTMGYHHLQVHKSQKTIRLNIELFEKIFFSFQRLNIETARSSGLEYENDSDLVFFFIIQRIDELIEAATKRVELEQLA